RRGHPKLLGGRGFLPRFFSRLFCFQPLRYKMDPGSGGNSRLSAQRGSDFIPSIFPIPLRTRPPTLWPPTRRRSPSAATTSRSFDHARSSGRVAATLSSHTQGCALSRPVGPHTRETPHLRHRPEVSKNRRACCLSPP